MSVSFTDLISLGFTLSQTLNQRASARLWAKIAKGSFQEIEILAFDVVEAEALATDRALGLGHFLIKLLQLAGADFHEVAFFTLLTCIRYVKRLQCTATEEIHDHVHLADDCRRTVVEGHLHFASLEILEELDPCLHPVGGHPIDVLAVDHHLLIHDPDLRVEISFLVDLPGNRQMEDFSLMFFRNFKHLIFRDLALESEALRLGSELFFCLALRSQRRLQTSAH